MALKEVNGRAGRRLGVLWRGMPVVQVGTGGTAWGTQCPSGLPPVARELVREQTALASLTRRWHLTDTLAPACVGSDVSCHEGKWHLSRAFFRPAVAAGAAEGEAGSAGPRPRPAIRPACWLRPLFSVGAGILSPRLTRYNLAVHSRSLFSLVFGIPRRAL